MNGPVGGGLELAEKLYPAAAPPAAAEDVTAPAHVVALRQSDPARVLYGTSGLDEVDFASAIPDDPGAAAQLKHISADIGMSTYQAQRLVARAANIRKDGPGDIGVQQRTSRSQLASAYGSADDSLELANRMLQRDSRLSGLVTRMGIGNDPEAISIFAELARSERARGRLD